MVPPWLLALIVLLVVCVIGWYVIYSRHAGVPEGFAVSEISSYIYTYLYPSIFNIAMEADAKEVMSTMNSPQIPFSRDAEMLMSMISMRKDQPKVIEDYTKEILPKINTFIQENKLTSSRPLIPFTTGMVIPNVRPVSYVTQKLKDDPVKNYMYQYILPSINNLYDTITKNNITVPSGPDAGMSAAPILYVIGLSVSTVATWPLDKLPMDQKIKRISEVITRFNGTLSEFKLPTLVPYTPGMTLPTVASAPTTGTSASSAPAAVQVQNTIQSASPTRPTLTSTVGATQETPDADYLALAKQALTGQTATLTPELTKFLEQVKTRVPVEYPSPTAANLAAAQGEDASGSLIVPGSLFSDPAVYKAFQKYIKPHETPTAEPPGLTANQKGAEAVQADAILTPSMRQMIRDDVRKAVGEELQAATDEYNNEYSNEYEIDYEYQ